MQKTKVLILLLILILTTGCATQKPMECCGGKETHQCGEFYSQYNCPETPLNFNYKNPINPTYSKWNNNRFYYPNTQTVYYVPVSECITPPLDNPNITRNTPRPEQLGQYRSRAINNLKSPRD